MGCCESSCCKSMPCPYPRLVGLWISDDATNRSNLLANHEREKRMTQYGCSQWKHEHYYKSCKGAVLEINPAGYVNYIEMDGRCARSVYSGPITNWDGPDGVWIGCCAPCFCCKKGCFHFDVVLPEQDSPVKMRVNGRILSKQGSEVEIPVVLATPDNSQYGNSMDYGTAQLHVAQPVKTPNS